MVLAPDDGEYLVALWEAWRHVVVYVCKLQATAACSHTLTLLVAAGTKLAHAHRICLRGASSVDMPALSKCYYCVLQWA